MGVGRWGEGGGGILADARCLAVTYTFLGARRGPPAPPRPPRRAHAGRRRGSRRGLLVVPCAPDAVPLCWGRRHCCATCDSRFPPAFAPPTAPPPLPPTPPSPPDSGCTAQACSFRDAYEELRRHNAEIVGVSGQDVASKAQFATAQRLTYPARIGRGGYMEKGVGCRGGGRSPAWPGRGVQGAVCDGAAPHLPGKRGGVYKRGREGARLAHKGESVGVSGQDVASKAQFTYPARPLRGEGARFVIGRGGVKWLWGRGHVLL